jgi:putative DNA methylase
MTKLVEVALPLEEISLACRRDKDRKTGTIKNVHKWFAPMPTPAWRALLFASLVDDPGDPDGRAALLEVIKELVPDNGGAPSEAVLAKANALIREATGGDLPTVYDPFCGGGSTLIEAQRLGLPAAGSDLNPVPVLITRVLTELVPKVAGRPALIGDTARLKGITGGPIDGFLADCRHYAERVRDEVWAEIGHLYPPAPGGGTVIAWLWARTVTCPNPACRAVAPLVSSFWLSKKKGAETWIDPVPQGPGQPVRFDVRTGAGGPPRATKLGRGGNFRCATCSEPVPEGHVKAEGKARRLGTQLLAVAVDSPTGRRYLAPAEAGAVPAIARPSDVPAIDQPDYARWFSSPAYGLREFADLFTNRQLVAMSAFADTVAKVSDWVRTDGGDDDQATAVASVLGLCVSKLAMSHSTQGRLEPPSGTSNGGIHPAFSRQALPMVWDFAELNPFSSLAGDWLGQLTSTAQALRTLPNVKSAAVTFKADAREGGSKVGTPMLLATDPPYFAQIGYADLSDFFYLWLRRALRGVHSDLFATVATPKAAELIAASYRHGGKDAATKYFIKGFTEVFANLRTAARPDLPMLVVYAHRQEESSDDGLTSTAWDAMLSAILASGLRIVGTWPIHATTANRQIGQGTNALASYVVLVCRPQEQGAKVVDLPTFRAALRAELPRAIRKLQEGAISSIDLGQATLGPGMAIFSHYRRVLDPMTGQGMSVGSALEVISQVQGEVLDEFVGDLDPWTRWAMAWYRDNGFADGTFDAAEKLCKTTNTSLVGLVRAGIVRARGGIVTLIGRDALDEGWTVEDDDRFTVWELVSHLVARLTGGGGEQAAAELLREGKTHADEARNLAYWLSLTAAAKSRAKDTLDFDALVTSWPQIARLAEKARVVAPGTLLP